MGTDRKMRIGAGVVVVRGGRGPDRAAVELIEAHALEGTKTSGVIEIGGARLFAKASPLGGRAGRRHALRRLFGLYPPRVREYENLRWLRSRLFQAPRPLAAAILWRRGLPRYQVLLTEEVTGARDLNDELADATPNERRGLAEELGREVGRMHALGFVHRDLHPRNLLVVHEAAHRRIVFVDAWRAAPHASLRGPAYDLACLFLEGAEMWDGGEQQRLLDAYVASRAAQGAAVSPRLLVQARAERKGLLRRLRREPARLRGQALPGPWATELTLG